MRFFLLLFLFPFLTQSLDSETNSPTYKFAVLIGEPIALNASENIKVENFDECTKKCGDDANCVMVYQANSSAPCYLFEWNSITQVTKNESGAVGTVGFKVYTEQPSCDLNLPLLLNGKIYPIDPKDTVNNLWKIDTAEDGWVITYIDKRDTGGLVCGNFTFGRPYVDGCNPECNITMVQVSAKPEDSINSTEQPVTSWNECMYWCHSNPDCFVAHFQDGSSTSCTWFAEGDICFLNKTEAAKGHHMAVKIPLSNTTCKLTTEQLLKNQSYPEDNPVWFMDTREDGWAMTFPSSEEPENVTCGNFKANRPYPDSCNPECNLTMVQLNGMPGPISRFPQISSASTWKECLYECQANRTCFAVYWQDGVSSNCTWYYLDYIAFINRTEPSEGHHMAIKIPLSNRSCKLTTEELLNDQYYVMNEDEQVSNQVFGCELHSVGSKPIKIPSVATVCHRNQPAPGITAAASKELCEEMDGHLATERFQGFFSTCEASNSAWNRVPLIWWLSDPYPKMGWRNAATEPTKIWVGLERVPGTNQFKWAAPEFAVSSFHTMTFCGVSVTFRGEVQTWAPGEPKNKPGYDCVYALKRANGDYYQGKPPFPDYHLYSAPCDSEGADGFVCATKLQRERGIITHTVIRTEYGVP